MSDVPQNVVPTPQQQAAAPQQIDVSKYIGAYIQLRDAKKLLAEKQAEQMKPINDKMAQIEAAVMAYIDSTGQENAKTKFGTATPSTKYSTSVQDPELFRKFVVDNENYDMANWTANLEAVQTYLKEHQTLPPGVKLTGFRTCGFRKPTKKPE